MSRLSKPAMFMGTLALIMVAVALVTTVIPFRQILDQGTRVEAATAELARIRVENGLLAGEVEALNTPEEIERLAREKLGYVMPGETAYVVLEPDETDQLVESEPIAEVQTPWYVELWNFFTGADLRGG
ncbi:MAG: FtsB family cell division protein [Acidimicrobiia bacterium]